MDRETVFDSMIQARAKKGYLTEPMASAMGVSLAVDEPAEKMIADSRKGLLGCHGYFSWVESRGFLRRAKNELDESVQALFRHEHNLQLGILDAERGKIGDRRAIRCREEIKMDTERKVFREIFPGLMTVSTVSIRGSGGLPSRSYRDFHS